MRIVLAGATGVIGIRLVSLLVDAGHLVLGLTRTPEKVATLRSLGAEAVVCNVYDAVELSAIIARFAPDVLLHELTDLADDPALIDDDANSRIRTEGTANLLAAARTAGLPRVLAQSVAWELEGAGGRAVAAHERAVLDYGGVVLRYGQFYGPGTYYPDAVPPPPRIHIDDAAQRTVALLTAPTGVVVVDEST